MNDEGFKQALVDVARGYVGSLFCLGVCGNQFSPEYWFCWTAIVDRNSSGMDYASIQRHQNLVEGCRRSNSEMSS